MAIRAVGKPPSVKNREIARSWLTRHGHSHCNAWDLGDIESLAQLLDAAEDSTLVAVVSAMQDLRARR